jgi:hypothetical protein
VASKVFVHVATRYKLGRCFSVDVPLVGGVFFPPKRLLVNLPFNSGGALGARVKAAKGFGRILGRILPRGPSEMRLEVALV